MRAFIAGCLGLALILMPHPAKADTLDQAMPSYETVTTESQDQPDNCRYIKITMTAYDYLGWWIMKYTGTANWCYDGFFVTSHTFATSWAGRFGWEVTSQDITVTKSEDCYSGSRYCWWSRYGLAHWKNCQYGFCLTDGQWIRQTIYGTGSSKQTGGDQ